jgi:hypothetical protein
MNKNNIVEGLTTGLVAGYGGKTEFKKNIRGTFETTSSHYEKDGIIYHDEWIEGGGQEIVKINGQLFTRVYAGGTVSEKKLDNLRIKKEEVINYLISRIKELGDKTRLFSDCETANNGDWGYEYKVLDREDLVEVTVGKEIIKYKDETVFVHCFVLSPAK